MSTDKSPIVLAFSGGLDTSFCVPWLKENYGRDVVTATVNTGDVLNISDAGSGANNTYALSDTTFQRTAASATGLVTYGTIESLNVTTGSGDDTVNISDTANDSRTSVNTGAGADAVTVTMASAGRPISWRSRTTRPTGDTSSDRTEKRCPPKLAPISTRAIRSRC